jgi:hypothetical protein
VRFLSGGAYAYGDADEALYRELAEADSIGGFVNQALKPQHPVRRL